MADLSNAGINTQKKDGLYKISYNIYSVFSFPAVTLQSWKTLIIFSNILINTFRSLMLNLDLVLSFNKEAALLRNGILLSV